MLDNEQIRALVAIVNDLSERSEGGDKKAKESLGYFLKHWPNALSYDSEGNFIGNPRYENGYSN